MDLYSLKDIVSRTGPIPEHVCGARCLVVLLMNPAVRLQDMLADFCWRVYDIYIRQPPPVQAIR